MILSFIVGVVLLAAYVQVTLTVMGGFWGGVVWAFLLQPVLGFLLWIREFTKNILAKARMWEWLRYKFDTWEQVAEWLNLTPGYEIDLALELGDGDWVPKQGGGYEVLTR